MASGKFGSAALAAATNTVIYTVGASVTTVNINVVNRGATDAKVRIALAASGTPGNADYIEYDRVLNSTASVTGGGVVERTGIAVSPGEVVVVYADTASCTARVHGYEEI